MGPFPFFDQTDENDHYGIMRTAPVVVGGQVTEPSRIIIGELSKVWAGAGGGAGGDASNANQFPVTPFNIGGDEKGSAGGGGAGGIQILSIGEIRIGPTGASRQTVASAAQERTPTFFDRVGGGGGGGSGGHIVLSSANSVVVEAEAVEGSAFNQALPFYTDSPAQLRHPARPLSAMGGQGGAARTTVAARTPRAGATGRSTRSRSRPSRVSRRSRRGATPPATTRSSPATRARRPIRSARPLARVVTAAPASSSSTRRTSIRRSCSRTDRVSTARART